MGLGALVSGEDPNELYESTDDLNKGSMRLVVDETKKRKIER
jgi:hypothetical protein